MGTFMSLAMQNTHGHFDCIFVFQQDVIKSAFIYHSKVNETI